MFKADEEFFDLELDDDFFHDAFNITVKSSTQKSLNVNPPVLPENFDTDQKNSFPESLEAEVENKINEPASCVSDDAPSNYPSALQYETNTPSEQSDERRQLSSGTNNVKPLSSTDCDFQLQNILPSDSENCLSANSTELCPEKVASFDPTFDRVKDTDPKCDFSKGVKFTTQKKLSFISYENEDLNSVFNFDPVEEFSDVSKSVESGNRILDSVKSKQPVSEECVQQKRRSLTRRSPISDLKCAFPALRDKVVLDTLSNSSKNLVLQPGNSKSGTISAAVLNSPSVNILNKQLDRQVQTPNSNVAARVNNSAFFNQNTPQNKLFVTRKRKFPGPAGILPELPPGADLSTLSEPESPIVSVSPKDAAPPVFVCSQSVIDEFEKPAWQTMLKDLSCGSLRSSVMDKFNISWVLQQAGSKQLPKGKVPVLCTILKNISFQGSEAKVTFADKTGEMNGMIHGKLLEEHQEKLQPGAVLVLKQVTVFSPNSRKHYLLVTPSNIISLYGVLGDKTSIIACSGSELMAMAEKWLQEVNRISRASPGNRQFSANSPSLREAPVHSPVRSPSGSLLKQRKSSGNVLLKQESSDNFVSFGARIAASSDENHEEDQNATQILHSLSAGVRPDTLNSSPCASNSTGNVIVSACDTKEQIIADKDSNISDCTPQLSVSRTTVCTEGHTGTSVDSTVTHCSEQSISGNSVPKLEEDDAAFKDEFDDLFLNLDEEALLSETW